MSFHRLKSYNHKWYLIIFIFFSCEKKIDLVPEEGNEFLIVEGWVTNATQDYTVKLTRSAAYSGGSPGVNLRVRNALVLVTDDLGEIDTLYEDEERVGIYKGRETYLTGRTYTLYIETSEGNRYESQPETLLPVAPIDSLYYEFVQETEFNLEGHQVKIDFVDPAENGNFYRWKWTGTYEDQTDWPPNGNPIGVEPPCCGTCFIQEGNTNDFAVLEDGLINGNKITRDIKLIPFNSRSKYHISVQLFSLNQDAYDFFDKLNKQKDNSSNIFDTAPVTIIGNMKNIDNPDDIVLGYFGASTVDERAMYIFRTDLGEPAYFESDPQIPCQTLPGATLIRPNFWE